MGAPGLTGNDECRMMNDELITSPGNRGGNRKNTTASLFSGRREFWKPGIPALSIGSTRPNNFETTRQNSKEPRNPGKKNTIKPP
jgi:hypothetical protein